MSNTIQPAAAADHDLTHRIHSYLHGLNRPNLRGLDVTVNHGEVILSGRLSSYYEKSLAINACRRVAGVMKLNELIEVTS